MCGIAGLVDFERPVQPGLLGEMLALIAYRGPDDEGRYEQAPFAIGMRRLSIIDLDGGHQPIANEDGTVMVVLNGEIYNYVELRDDLQARGHVFRTRTDTEVLVHLYEEFGDGFPKHLNGMFGLALWDLRRRRLLLARDHLGIKPLYWQMAGSRLLFASEIKCLLRAAAPARPELDRPALAMYLHLGYVPGTATGLSGIYKLRPAQRLVFEPGAPPRLYSYWNLAAAYQAAPNRRPDDLAEQVAALLQDAVRLQLRSDVPVGTFLSGGLDSSGVTALAASMHPDIHTFGIGFTDHYFDETPYARQVADHLHTRHHQEIVNPDTLLNHLDLLAWHLDEPNADPAMLPSYVVSRLARQHVTVALSGNGGDELFGGYPWHGDPPPRGTWAARIRAHVPRSLRRMGVGALGLLAPNRARAIGARLVPDNNVIGLAYWADHAAPDILAATAPWALAEFWATEWIQAVCDQVATADPINQRLYYDTTNYLCDQILPMVDRASMAVSLEVRVPLLDKRLVELMAAVPGTDKFDAHGGKCQLKAALAERLPADIFTRRKLGFGLPVVRWIKTAPLRGRLRDLAAGRLAAAGLIEPSGLAGYLDQPELLERNAAFLWQLLVLELWMRNHLAG